MENRIIKSEKEYDVACNRLYKLMQTNEAQTESDTPEGDEMELLALLIEQYESRQYAMDAPDPIEAIKFRMEQMNLKQVDIAPIFGGKTRVSEVLNRKRPLSLKMIILLNRILGIPFDSLIQGKSEVYLERPELDKVMENSAIRDYLKINPKKRTKG